MKDSMTITAAINRAYTMHIEWVSAKDITLGKGYNLGRIHTSMLAEHQANRHNPTRCSQACARETVGQLILLGKLRKILDNPNRM
jgi:hypothetical protein